MPVHFASGSPPPNVGGGGDAEGSVWGNFRLILGQPSFSQRHHHQVQQQEAQSDIEGHQSAAQHKKAVGFLRSFSAKKDAEVLRLGPEEGVPPSQGTKDWKTFVAGRQLASACLGCVQHASILHFGVAFLLLP